MTDNILVSVVGIIAIWTGYFSGIAHQKNVIQKKLCKQSTTLTVDYEKCLESEWLWEKESGE